MNIDLIAKNSKTLIGTTSRLIKTEDVDINYLLTELNKNILKDKSIITKYYDDWMSLFNILLKEIEKNDLVEQLLQDRIDLFNNDIEDSDSKLNFLFSTEN